MYEYYTRWTAPRWTWHNGESGTIPVIVPNHVGAEAKNRSASVRNRNAATEYVKVNIWKYSTSTLALIFLFSCNDDWVYHRLLSTLLSFTHHANAGGKIQKKRMQCCEGRTLLFHISYYNMTHVNRELLNVCMLWLRPWLWLWLCCLTESMRRATWTQFFSIVLLCVLSTSSFGISH